jgi:hypothetical protein
MSHYRARNNEIVDQDGRQIAIVLPTACTKRAAKEMAAFAAQQMNHIERDKQRRAAASIEEKMG